MKTSHELARELLELPDLPVNVDMWWGKWEIVPELDGDIVDNDYFEPTSVFLKAISV